MRCAVAALAILTLACGREGAESTQTTTTAATATRATTLAPRDAAFITNAIRHSTGHVQLATTVAAQSESPEIRALTADVIAAHNVMIDRITRVADAHHLPLPVEPDPDLAAIDERLSTMTVADLETAYVNAILNTYSPLLRHYAEAAESGASEDVRSLGTTAQEQLAPQHARAQVIRAMQAGRETLIPIAPAAPDLQRPVP